MSWGPEDFAKVKRTAAHVEKHAGRVASFAGDVGGHRIAQPTEAWTKGEIESMFLFSLGLLEEAGVSRDDLIRVYDESRRG